MVAHELAPVPERKPLPESIRVDTNPRFSPNELRVMKAQTGRSLDSIMNEPENAVQAMIWKALRRAGFDPTFDECADVEAEFPTPEPPDPFTGAPSTT
jgi:hypothetical protein